MKKIWLIIILLLGYWVTLPNLAYGQNKEELILAFGSEPEGGWDPIKGSGHYGTSLFQSSLLKRNLDLEVVNDLAENYQVSEDRLQWQVEIKDQVKFSDGQALTARDVAFTYLKAKEAASATVDLTNLAEVKVESDTRLTFTLKQPDVSFISKMCALGIVPEHAYNEDYANHPIGSGPFQFVEWKKGEQLITQPNPYYYGQAMPYKKITFLFVDSDQAAMIAKSQLADVIQISYKDADIPFQGYHLESFETIDNRGLSFPMTQNRGEKTPEGYPIGNDVTSDIAIRKAINMAINRQQIIDQALNGQGSKASSIADKMPWWNETTQIEKDGDIQKANELLDQAGWKKGSDGVREKDGVKAQLNLYFAYKDRENIAVSVAQQLQEIGIALTPIYGTWDEIQPKMYSEIVLFGWGGYDPLEIYYNYSSHWRGKDFYNPNYYANKTVDKYFNQALQSEDEEQANVYWKKAQWDGTTGLSHLGDAPWAWLVNENHLYLVRDGLDIGKQMIQPHGGGWPLAYTIADWKWQP